jgi:cytochrome c peroxidase
MGVSDLGALVPKLAALEYYKGLFRQAYSSDQITLDRMTYAMATFLGAIRSVNTRLDQANLGKASLSALEIEGQTLFDQKYNCGGCHNVTAIGYSSGQFRDIGLDASYTDAGREAITGMPEDKGKFKVPNLRNVALTGPYMHDGRFKTLDDVLEHYSHNIKASANLDTVLKITGTGGPMRMEISAHEKQAIIAFLGSLVDVDMITNPAYSDPFKTK